MKIKILYLVVLLFTINNFGQTSQCGAIVNTSFDVDGALPTGWTEYNTSGRVSVDAGRLKLDYTTDKPAVYHTFDAVTDNFSYAFDVAATRNYVNCNMNLISSTGKYLASVTFALNSNLNIQYATSMAAGIPGSYSGSLIPSNFVTNTTYSISLNADFAHQKINFYNNGVLMAADIPFLETTQEVAKIDIQLNYMYNNEGRFFFDNISLLSGAANRLALTNNVAAAETLVGSASIGNKYNQYPQSVYDSFQLAITNAKAVLADCNSASNTIDNTLSDLQTAQDVFTNSRVNNPVIKIYEGYNFSGEEHQIYCGYYNGTLGTYDDWGVSFTLEKGYMVTFAESINGKGVSKVYVAAETNLRINLPENLQKKVSFIRVCPWNEIHKKGLGAKGDDVVAALNNSWYYNWGTTGEAIGSAEFVPNQWGGGTVEKAISLGERMDISHYMAFNEPDNDDQSNMTVDNAIIKYENLLASGLRLGSPAVTDGAAGAAWRDEFMTKAEEKGLRVDYIVVHYYKKSTPTGFYNWLKAIYDKWKRPIWIKEFNYGATWVANKPTTNEAASEGLESYINMLDATPFVERYAVFTWQPDQPVYSLMAVRNPITLSASGIMYRDHVSPIAYTQEIYEQGTPLSVIKNSKSPNVLLFNTIVSDGSFNLIYSDEFENSEIELTIYNTSGQLVKKVSDSRTRIDVSTFSSGVYFIKIASDLGNFDGKIIVP
ncbi:glycosyl hydrolase [Mariniflexile sp.]|uniref:glycosyl hydrolase n=1 Tax=Mariniflexile sp. TaxID=1979402 RepID=UPI0035689937